MDLEFSFLNKVKDSAGNEKVKNNNYEGIQVIQEKNLASLL